MEVLYLLTNPARPEECQLPPTAKLGAVYSDKVGQEQIGLKTCLASLKQGDTLYVARERHLSRDFGQAIELLGNLARKGIHVWLGRTGQLLESRTSPFLGLSPDAADAIVNFSKAFTLRRAKQGFQRAKRTGARVGRRENPLPDNFEEARTAWKSGKMTQVAAAEMCGMPISTFCKKVHR